MRVSILRERRLALRCRSRLHPRSAERAE
jgi:hypothetical protein